MNSRLYRGTIMHERKSPVTNRFSYGIYYLCADLDELDRIEEVAPRFKHNRFGWMYLLDRDHGARDGSPLRPWIEELVGRVGVDLTGGRVELLTFPRVLGFRFYPVGFWYCYDANGALVAVLAEVQNTFREHHNYLLHDHGKLLEPGAKPEAEKVFYVSPLMPVKGGRYQFRFTRPEQRVHVGIYDFIDDVLTIVVSLDMEQREITDREIARLIGRFGPMSLRAGILIVLQFLKIWAKGAHYVPKPAPPLEETSL